jgi:hypothetical protein
VDRVVKRAVDVVVVVEAMVAVDIVVVDEATTRMVMEKVAVVDGGAAMQVLLAVLPVLGLMRKAGHLLVAETVIAEGAADVVGTTMRVTEAISGAVECMVVSARIVAALLPNNLRHHRRESPDRPP